MLRILWLSALLAFALTSSAVVAQTMEATPIPMQPKPDLTPMHYFVGTWSCSFKSARRPTPQLFTSTARIDPTGYWLVENSTLKPVSWFPHASTQLDMITYDPNAKRWVDVETDSLGGYDLSASGGWTGDTLVWKDLAFVPSRDVVSATVITLKKVSDTKFTTAATFTTKKGRAVGVTTACTKT